MPAARQVSRSSAIAPAVKATILVWRLRAELVKESGELTEEIWVPATLTRCFEVRRLIVRAEINWSPGNERCSLVIVGSGEGVFEADGRTLAGGIGARFFFAAQGEPVKVRPKNEGDVLELWVCQPAGE